MTYNRFLFDVVLYFGTSVRQKITRILYSKGGTWTRNYCHLSGPDTRPLAMAQRFVKMCRLKPLLVIEHSSAKVDCLKSSQFG